MGKVQVTHGPNAQHVASVILEDMRVGRKLALKLGDDANEICIEA